MGYGLLALSVPGGDWSGGKFLQLYRKLVKPQIEPKKKFREVEKMVDWNAVKSGLKKMIAEMKMLRSKRRDLYNSDSVS